MRCDAVDCGLKHCRVSALGGDAAQLEKRSQVVWLHIKDLRNELLKFSFASLAALALNLERKLVLRLKIRGVELHGLTQIRDCAHRVAAITAKNSEQVVDLIVFGSELARAFKSFGGEIEITLAQREDSPVGPRCRLPRCKLRGMGQ